MKTIKQRRGYDCGQCCVAMVTESTYEEAAEAVGHINSTKTKDIFKAVWKLGWGCSGKLIRLRFSTFHDPWSAIGERAVVKVQIEEGKSGWHWVAKIGDLFYDPGWVGFRKEVGETGLDPTEVRGRMMSYLSVWRP